MPPLLPGLVLLFCAGLAARPACADSRAAPTNPEARAHFDRGGTLFGLKEFERAIDEYKQGAMIEALPVFDLALGQCYRMLHRFDDALWYYHRFVRYGHPTDNVRKGVNDLITLMQSEVDRQAQNKPASLPSPAPPVAAVDRREPWYQDGLSIGLAGAGMVAVGAAGYLFSEGTHLHAQANATPESQARRNEMHDQARRRNVLGTATGLGGAALLVTVAFRRATHHRGRVMPAATSWGVGAAGNGVMVFGRF